MKHLFGYTPDPAGVAQIVADPSVPVYEMTDQQLSSMATSGDDKRPPIILFDALKVLHPKWKRGAQAIGDCVSWGWELGTTLSVAVDIQLKLRPWIWPGEFATEPYYGGARVEALGKSRGGWSDGAYGGAAAKFGTNWGALARADWSQRTGNAEHNLLKYSGDKSKNWGNFGCGGADDKGQLDAIAKEFALAEAPMVKSYDQAKAVIESGYPVVVCSNQGLSDKRDKYGFVRASGVWYHCMVFAGVRYDRPGLLDVNSWGNSWGLGNFFVNVITGEVIEYWPEVQKCSAWLDAATCDRMLRQEDSYAVCGVTGLKRREINWTKGWEIGLAV